MDDLTNETLVFLLNAVRWDAQERAWNTPWEYGEVPEALKEMRRRIETGETLLSKLSADGACNEAEELATLRRLVRKHPEEALSVLPSKVVADEFVQRCLIRAIDRCCKT